MGHIDRAALDGVELEYESHGAGEPVVLVHHGAGADWFSPLLEEPALTGGFTSNFHNDLNWRWAATPEERLLAQAGDEPAPLPPPPEPAARPEAKTPDKPPVARTGKAPAAYPSTPAAAAQQLIAPDASSPSAICDRQS